MSFHQPAVLWLLALPVIWAYWQWVRRGHPLVLPFDHGRQREGRRWRGLVLLAETLPALLLTVAVLLLAGPRRPAPPENERVLNNILICLDVSTSMNMRFSSFGSRPGGTRFDAAMQAIRGFCEFRKGDAFGLTIFGSEYLHWFPPTRELSAIQNALPFVRPNNLPPWFGGTLIANALAGCRDRLARTREGDRAIILVTDGDSGDFQGGRDRQIGEELARQQIRVFTVLIGNDQLFSDGVYKIAALTGGKVFQAGDAGTLDAVFREIDQMQKTRFKPSTADWVNAYRPFIWTGLALAVASALALFGLRFTPW